jgi:hypothetical protein
MKPGTGTAFASASVIFWQMTFSLSMRDMFTRFYPFSRDKIDELGDRSRAIVMTLSTSQNRQA